MSTETPVATKPSERCGCDRGIWRPEFIRTFLITYTIGCSFFAIPVPLLLIKFEPASHGAGTHFMIIFGILSLLGVWIMFRQYCVGQVVYQFSDAEGKAHLHTTKPQLLNNIWFVHYTNNLDGSSRAVKITGLILQLRNRGLWRKCRILTNCDDRKHRWVKVQCWQPFGLCMAYDDNGGQIGQPSSQRLLAWLNQNNSADDNHFSEREALDRLGVRVSEVVQQALTEKRAVKSEIVGILRQRLEAALSACNISAVRVASWREQAKQRLEAPSVPTAVAKDEALQQEAVTT